MKQVIEFPNQSNDQKQFYNNNEYHIIYKFKISLIKYFNNKLFTSGNTVVAMARKQEQKI